MASFEEWATTISGMLAFASIDGFLENQDAFREKVNEDDLEWEVFLRALLEVFGSAPFTVDQVVPPNMPSLFIGHIPTELKPADGGSLARRVGRALGKYEDTRFGEDGIHVVRVGHDGHTKRIRWAVRVDAKTQ